MTKAPRQQSHGFIIATFNQAMAEHRAGDLARAETLYKLVLARDERQFDAMHMLGIVAGQRGDFHEGVRRITDPLQIRPGATDGGLHLGRMQAELRDYADAGASYRTALALDPNLPLAHNNFSIVLRRLGQCDEALLHGDKAIALAPRYPEAWNNRGNALFDLGRQVEALESYDRALGLAPGLAEAMLGRGNVLLALERFEEAVASYDKALSVRPDTADCHAGRGLALHALKRFDAALASYDKALAVTPDSGDGWFARGNALYELRRFPEA